MRNACLSLTFLFFSLSLLAQKNSPDGGRNPSSLDRDSTRLDLGWLTIDKDLAQTITVKGADLEKMPFVNLSDAIRAWFFGGYTVPGTLAYVVDGNPVTDVNLYPIYEIEEAITGS